MPKQSPTLETVFPGAFLENETVEFNTRLPLQLEGVKPAAAAAAAEDLLKKAGLGAKLKAKAGDLDSAERYRAAVARALASDPDILYAPNPSSLKDAREAEACRQLLKAVSQNREVALRCRAGGGEDSILHFYAGEEYTDGEDPNRYAAHPQRRLPMGTALHLALKRFIKEGTGVVPALLTCACTMAAAVLLLCGARSGSENLQQAERMAMAGSPITVTCVENSDAGLAEAERYAGTGEHGGGEVYARGNAKTSGGAGKVSMLLSVLQSKKITSLRISAVEQDIGVEPVIYTADGSPVSAGGDGSVVLAKALPEGDTEYMTNRYEVISGRLPVRYDELVLFLDENNEVSRTALQALGLEGALNEEDYLHYETVLSLTLRLLLPSDLYRTGADGVTARIEDEDLLKDTLSGSEVLKIVGIVRDRTGTPAGTALGYTAALPLYVVEATAEKEGAVTAAEPELLRLYARTAEDRAALLEAIEDYNRAAVGEGRWRDCVMMEYASEELHSGTLAVLNTAEYALFALALLLLLFAFLLASRFWAMGREKEQKELAVLTALGVPERKAARPVRISAVLAGLLAGVLAAGACAAGLATMSGLAAFAGAALPDYAWAALPGFGAVMMVLAALAA